MPFIFYDMASLCVFFHFGILCGCFPRGPPDILLRAPVYLSMYQSFFPPSYQCPVRISDAPVQCCARIYLVFVKFYIICHDVEYLHGTFDVRLSTHPGILFIPSAFTSLHDPPHIKSNSVGVSISFSASCRYPTPSRK